MPVLFPVINNSKACLNNDKKSQTTGFWPVHSNSRCIIYSTSLFTQKHNNPHRFGAAGGGKGNALYQQRDLQSLRSLEKKRIQLCRENKPKGSRVQRAAGPRRAPSGFDRRVGWSRKLYHRAGGAQRAGLFSYKSCYFFNSQGMLPVCLDTNTRRNNPFTGISALLSLKQCSFETFLSTLSVRQWRKHSAKTMSVPALPKVK